MVPGVERVEYLWGRDYHQLLNLPSRIYPHDGKNKVVSQNDEFDLGRKVGWVDNETIGKSQRI